MTDKKTPEYDESKITTLSPLDHIRLRPGMYAGRIGNGDNTNDGIYVLTSEVIANSLDEFIMGFGKRIDVSLEGFKISIRDKGRGIPLGKLLECVSEINTSGKFNNDVFQYAIGLNGVGTKVTNALSSHFLIRSMREGEFRELIFSEGKLKSDTSGQCNEHNGTYVEFVPSFEIFPADLAINEDFIINKIKWYAYLNRGLTISYNGTPFKSTGGLLDFVKEEVDNEKFYDIISHRSKSLEFAFTHTGNFGESYYAFANGQYTNEGGTHLTGFREGLLKAVNEYSKKSFQGSDVRQGIFGSVAVKVMEPQFESQTKNKLANTELRSKVATEVKEVIIDFLHKNKQIADRLMEKVTANEKMRKGINDLKKASKEKSKKAALRIPKLRDCKHHYNDGSSIGKDSMIFLTEGDSATGSMIAVRDVMTQALFSLRGKPLNTFDTKIDAVYKNEELFFIMKALNIEDGIDGLRYNKVIIAADADIDGKHIINLLICFFLTHFPEIIHEGHLKLLITPLFSVYTKKERIYCYSEEERDVAAAKLGKTAYIQRFKGLGELNKDNVKDFIGEKMILKDVTTNHTDKVQEWLEFYQGKNTPARKQFIMNNLR